MKQKYHNLADEIVSLVNWAARKPEEKDIVIQTMWTKLDYLVAYVGLCETKETIKAFTESDNQ